MANPRTEEEWHKLTLDSLTTAAQSSTVEPPIQAMKNLLNLGWTIERKAASSTSIFRYTTPSDGNNSLPNSLPLHVQNQEHELQEYGICIACRSSEMCKVLHCAQCPNLVHSCCAKRNRMSTETSIIDWGLLFCSNSCKSIHISMRNISGLRLERGNFILTFMGRQWPLDEEKDKLIKVIGIMRQCFNSEIDTETGDDVFQRYVFNKKESGRRFYTLLLEFNNNPAAALLFRIWGTELAELPYVGTVISQRKQGACRIIFEELVNKLTELGVRKLVLPALPNALPMWMAHFGFSKMSKAERDHLRHFPILSYKNTILCQKKLSVQ